MSTPSPAPRRSFNFAAWLPSGKAWLWVVGAFAIGLGLFAWVWSSNRDRGDGFYRSGDTPPTSAQPFYAPLPAPASADGEGVAPAASPQPSPAAAGGEPQETPQLVENPNPPAPPQSMPSAPQAPAAPSAGPGAQTAASPLPGNRAPQYPAASLRRGESGTVRVRVEVTEQGGVDDAEVVEGSGSRALDRAALSAVRSWRFKPAMRGGQPVAGAVIVPITFNANQ